MTKLEHLIKITIDPWADLPRIPRGFDKWGAYYREIERREINHSERGGGLKKICKSRL